MNINNNKFNIPLAENHIILTPLQYKMTDVTIIFGNPKCNCENYGICKISQGFDLYNKTTKNNKAKALLSWSNKKADLTIKLNSIAADVKFYQFKNYSFNIISEYRISNSIIKASHNTHFFIKPGLYTYRNKDIFKLKFHSKVNSYSSIYLNKSL